MKKTTLKTQEIYEIWSDQTGQGFPHNLPEVEVKLSFLYGSKYDESELTFHFTDEEVQPLLELIKSKLCAKSKAEMQHEIESVGGNNNQQDTNTELLSFFLR